MFCKQGRLRKAVMEIQAGVFCSQCYLPCGITNLGSVTTQAVNIMGNPASEAGQILNMRIIIVICSMVSCEHSLYSNTCNKQTREIRKCYFKWDGLKWHNKNAVKCAAYKCYILNMSKIWSPFSASQLSLLGIVSEGQSLLLPRCYWIVTSNMLWQYNQMIMAF